MSSYLDMALSLVPSSTTIFLTLSTIGLAGALYATSKRIQYIGRDEQLLLKNLTEKTVVNGPGIVFPSPFSVLSYKKRKAVSLKQLQYVSVKDTTTGDVKVIEGPKLYFLGPYEEPASVRDALVLKDGQGLVVSNRETGESRLVKGPTTFVPAVLESVESRVDAKVLGSSDYIKLQDKLTGEVWIERGEQVLFLKPHWVARTPVRSAYSLKAHQYVRLQDQVKGTVRVIRGENLVFPDPHEECMDGGVQDVIDLQAWEYCKIQDRTTGKLRVEKGEALVWLGPNEQVIGAENERAVRVDSDKAALVRNRRTGEQKLVETHGLFFPTEDEEVIEVRHKIRLADHEAIVLKDDKGDYHYYFGDATKGTPRAFFVPPYWETVTLMWSRGRRRERRDLAITTFDMRPQYMSFEFNCRTSDNVEMVLEGTFFWVVHDLAAMLRYTGDASGDVCAHARSCFIQLVSKVTLAEFMDRFNEIAKNAHSEDDEFYSQRGISILSLEVTRYQCADASTARILEQIIAETTNRMNRLSVQESENEVALARLKGELDLTNAQSELLDAKHKQSVEAAQAEGRAEAERCVSFLQAVRAGTEEDFVNNSDTMATDLWHTLRKNEALKDVSTGNAQVYFTPQDAHLTIESRT